MQNIILSILTAVLLIPNLLAITFAIEDWPLTPAPMFAHYVDSTTPRYRFVFNGELADNTQKSLGFYSAGANWSLMRYFFKYVYGATPSGGVFAIFESDSADAFSNRLGKFFKSFSIEVEKRETVRLKHIELWLESLSEDNLTHEKKLVGIFDCTTSKFTKSQD